MSGLLPHIPPPPTVSRLVPPHLESVCTLPPQIASAAAARLGHLSRGPSAAMTSSRDRRIAKELADIQADRDNSGVYAAPADGVNLSHLKGTIPAPPETPYAGGVYQIDIQIPDGYPFKSPVMRFETMIWHPNVSSQTVGPWKAWS